ncbi:MAG TPA: ethanolamine ammonia-lyase reactivating factor EutA [Gemmataceae bacterium]|nr:ethanolamine ammonia-lyase reactivating factor EutA [Gemmataceae bacterium]
MEDVKLIGLDFGTTTSSAVIARARLLHNRVSGRVELSQISECFRSAIAFTPMDDDRVDETKTAMLLNSWLAQGMTAHDRIFGGGALLTGLTAQKENAAALVSIIRERVGDAIIARADDPRLESWLAFMGNTAKLSRQHPETPFINLDIGGGTTNLAMGINGEVLTTGCLFIGARHVQVEPGTYRIAKLSSYARHMLEHLGIRKSRGDELTLDEMDQILGCYVNWLIAAVAGNEAAFAEPLARLHEQAPFPASPSFKERPVITLSGGVGELVYATIRGQAGPSTTAFGDLGIDLAARITRNTPWADDFRNYIPEGLGRATSFGLLRHSTQVSGSTLFLSDPSILPLRDLPIFGTIAAELPQAQWHTIRELLKRSENGGCVQIEMMNQDAASVRALGTRIAESLRSVDFSSGQPLVIIVPGNVGKALGHYITEWGARPLKLVVIDEIAAANAQFVQIGRLHDRVVPVSFYGLQG